MPDKLVLDTSAVLALLENEPEAARVEDILRQARRTEIEVHLAFITLMETEYTLIRRRSRSGALQGMTQIASWPVVVSESNAEWRHHAANVKARGGLSFADAWVAALAILLDADLVHKDPEFDSVPGLRSIRL